MNFDTPSYFDIFFKYKNIKDMFMDFSIDYEKLLIEGRLAVTEMLAEFKDVFDEETYQTIFNEIDELLKETKIFFRN